MLYTIANTYLWKWLCQEPKPKNVHRKEQEETLFSIREELRLNFFYYQELETSRANTLEETKILYDVDFQKSIAIQKYHIYSLSSSDI